MSSNLEHAVNQAAYQRLKATIATTYPPKQFVAVAGGNIVADDVDFDILDQRLTDLGFGPTDAIVVRVGDEAFDYVTII